MLHSGINPHSRAKKPFGAAVGVSGLGAIDRRKHNANTMANRFPWQDRQRKAEMVKAKMVRIMAENQALAVERIPRVTGFSSDFMTLSYIDIDDDALLRHYGLGKEGDCFPFLGPGGLLAYPRAGAPSASRTVSSVKRWKRRYNPGVAVESPGERPQWVPRYTQIGGKPHMLVWLGLQAAAILSHHGQGVGPDGQQPFGPGGIPAYFGIGDAWSAVEQGVGATAKYGQDVWNATADTITGAGNAVKNWFYGSHMDDNEAPSSQLVQKRDVSPTSKKLGSSTRPGAKLKRNSQKTPIRGLQEALDEVANIAKNTWKETEAYFFETHNESINGFMNEISRSKNRNFSRGFESRSKAVDFLRQSYQETGKRPDLYNTVPEHSAQGISRDTFEKNLQYFKNAKDAVEADALAGALRNPSRARPDDLNPPLLKSLEMITKIGDTVGALTGRNPFRDSAKTFYNMTGPPALNALGTALCTEAAIAAGFPTFGTGSLPAWLACNAIVPPILKNAVKSRHDEMYKWIESVF